MNKPSVFACERVVLKECEKWSSTNSLVRDNALYEAIMLWLRRREEENN